MPTVCGTWDEHKDYPQFAIVALNGGSFLARKDNPGVCPGDDWQLIASAGKPGKQGPPGARGDRGERGLQGEAGTPALVIVGWRIDRKAFAATPVFSDGSTAPPLELRDLFEQFQIETRDGRRSLKILTPATSNALASSTSVRLGIASTDTSLMPDSMWIDNTAQ
jgi:hypothetical protein